MSRNSKNYQQEVDARLGALRHNTGGTYRAAGEASGIGPSTISAWDRKIRVPRSDSMAKLREAS